VPLGYAVAIVAAAAAGLHYAHERRGADKRPLGIVHRDVSPSNILVGYDGSIKVVDFGIAKATMRQETRSGGLKGKVSYMSPEQCRSDEIDRRSDVYSLGVVLYELATTTRLFKGENDYLVMDQIVNGRVSLPRIRRPDLPNELSAIIMRALAPDPERRYFTADELRVALDQFANKAGLTTSTSGVAAYMRKQFGERPEPWADLGGHVVGSLDDVRTSVGEQRPASWTEQGRGEDSRRSSGAMPRLSGPISRVAGSDVASDVASHPSGALAAERSSIVRLPSTPPPTDSKMAWESQPPRLAASRGFTPTKVAMICAPLIVILGIAIWRLAGTGSSSDQVAIAQPMPPAAAAPAPVVTPIPEPVRSPPTEVAIAPAAPSPAVTVRPEPVPARRSSPSSPAPKRVATAKAVELPAAAAKIDPAVTAPAPVVPAPGSAATPPAPGSAAAAMVTPAVVPAAPPAPVVPAAAPAVAAAVPPPVVEIGLPQLGHSLVERVASDHSRDLSKCDDKEDLHGDVTVKFMIDANGKVSKAQVATSMKKPKFVACLLRVLQKFQFPKQGPGGAQATYTLSFQ
jgi:TonB family protein